jgi:hypothetical protein
MGHEDFIMIAAISLSIVLQFVSQSTFSWLPAAFAGLYKYYVDIRRERFKNRKTNKEVIKKWSSRRRW